MCGESQSHLQPVTRAQYHQFSTRWIPESGKNVTKTYNTCQITETAILHIFTMQPIYNSPSRYKKRASKTKQWMYRLPTIWLICYFIISSESNISAISCIYYLFSQSIIYSIAANAMVGAGPAPFKIVLLKNPSFILVILEFTSHKNVLLLLAHMNSFIAGKSLVEEHHVRTLWIPKHKKLWLLQRQMCKVWYTKASQKQIQLQTVSVWSEQPGRGWTWSNYTTAKGNKVDFFFSPSSFLFFIFSKVIFMLKDKNRWNRNKTLESSKSSEAVEELNGKTPTWKHTTNESHLVRWTWELKNILQ